MPKNNSVDLSRLPLSRPVKALDKAPRAILSIHSTLSYAIFYH